MKVYKITMTVRTKDNVGALDVSDKFKFYGTNSLTDFTTDDAIYVEEIKPRAWRVGDKVKILEGTKTEIGKIGIIRKVYPDEGVGVPLEIQVDDCVRTFGENEIRYYGDILK